MIEFEGFQVEFDEFTLGPLSFSIASGERVSLVGANGAGKSTTLRGIAGLLPVDYEGCVRVDGVEVAESGPEIRRTVGLLPERMLGFGWMTVAEHFAFLSSFHPTWDTSYVQELVRRLDLPGGTKLANLSKGTQVKLSLASVEGYRPPILLLDEPTAGIDPVMRDDLLSMLSGWVPPESGRTVLLSSHILEDVEAVSDRVLLLRDGQLVDDVTITELRANGDGTPISKQLLQRLRAS